MDDIITAEQVETALAELVAEIEHFAAWLPAEHRAAGLRALAEAVSAAEGST